MDFDSGFNSALSLLHSDFGVDATYTPKSTGIPQTLRVVTAANNQENPEEFQARSPVINPAFYVRKTDLADPKIGDQIVINSQSYIVDAVDPFLSNLLSHAIIIRAV